MQVVRTGSVGYAISRNVSTKIPYYYFTYAYLCIHIYAYLCILVHTPIYAYLCIPTCAYLCIHICIYPKLKAFVYILSRKLFKGALKS